MKKLFTLLLVVFLSISGLHAGQGQDNSIPSKTADADKKDSEQAGSAQDTETEEERARFDKRAQQFERILYRNPRPGTAFDLWYRHYLDAGKLDLLERELEARVTKDTKDAKWRLIIGMLQLRRGKPARAITAFDKACELDESNHIAFLQNGLTHIRQGKVGRGVQLLELALKKDPPRLELLDIYKHLGRAYLRQGNSAKATETWKLMIKQFPNDTLAMEDLAELLRDEGDLKGAIEQYEGVAKLVRKDPLRLAQIEIEIAQLQLRDRQAEKALAAFEQILGRLKSDSPIANDIRRRIREYFLNRSDMDGWIAFCTKRVDSHPDNVDAKLQLATAYSQNFQTKKSIQYLEEVLKLAPKRRDVRELYVNELESADRIADAIEHCEVLCNQNPQDVGLLMRHGQLVLANDDAGDRTARERLAVEVWKKIAAIREDDPGLPLRVAETCRDALSLADLAQLGLKKGDLKEAILKSPLLVTAEANYREATRRAPGKIQYHEYLGEFLYFIGKRKEALGAWNEIVKHDNSNQTWQQLAQILARHKFVNEAVNANDKCIELDKDNFDTWDFRIDLFIQLGDTKRAVQAWEKLKALAEDDNQLEKALHRIVDIYAAADQLDAEIARRQAAIVRSGGNLHDHWALAMLLSEQFQFDAAIKQLDAAIKLAPENPRLLRDLADALHRDDRPREAVKYFQRLVKLEPRSRTDFYEKIIEIELQLRDTISAAKTADILVTLSPSNVNAYRIKAMVAFQSGEVAKALDTLRRAVRVAPRDTVIRNELALALRDQGKHAEAMEHFWRCFELEKKIEDRLTIVGAMADVAKKTRTEDQFLQRLKQFQTDDPKLVALCVVEVHHRNRDYKHAFEALRNYLRKDPQDVDVLRRLAQLAETQKDLETAIRFQQELSDLVPSEENLKTLARLYTRVGNFDQARAAWVKLLQQSKNPEIILTAVDEKITEGQYAQALAMADTGVAHSPSNWVLLFRSGCLELGMDRFDKARERFQAILALAASSRISTTNSAPATQTTGANKSASAPNPLGIEFVTEMLSKEITNLPETRLLQQGRQAFSDFERYREIHSVMKRARPVPRSTARSRVSRGRMPRNRFTIPAGPKTIGEAKLASHLALCFVSMREGKLVQWLDGMLASGKDDAQNLETAVVALGATDSLENHNEILQRIAKLIPNSALPHLARFVKTPNRVQLQSRLSAFQREKELAASSDSFAWISQNRPNWAKGLFANYCTRLIYLGQGEKSDQILMDRIKAAKTLRELLQLGKLPLMSKANKVQLAYLVRLNELRAKLPVEERQSSALAVICSMISLPALDFAHADQRKQLFVATIDYLVAPNLVAPKPYRIYNAPGAAGGVRSGARGLTTSMLVSQLALSQSVPIRGSVPRQSSARTRNRTKGTFPAANGIYNDAHQRLARIIFDQLQQQGQTEHFMEYLTAEADNAKPTERAKLLSCKTSLLWWRGKSEEALAVYERVCEETPENTPLRLSLAQAYHTRGEHAKALATLNLIKNPNESEGNRKKTLYEATLKAWGRTVGVKTLQGHEGTVRVVRFSPDGKFLATGSYDNTIRIWELATGKNVTNLEGHEDFVLDIAFSADGKMLASGGYDRDLMIWSVESGQLVKRLKGHSGVIRAVTFVDKNRVASAGDEKNVRIWDLESGEIIKQFEREHRIVSSVVFSPDGKTLLVASGPKLLVWDVESGKLQRTITGHKTAVRAAAVSPDGKRIATGSNDRSVKVWDAKTGEMIYTYQQHGHVIRSVAFSPDGKFLVSGSEDRKVLVHDLTLRQWIARFDGHSQSITHVDVSPAGFFASSSYSNAVQLWRIASDEDINAN